MTRMNLLIPLFSTYLLMLLRWFMKSSLFLVLPVVLNFNSVVRIKQCYESINLVIGSIVDNLLLLSFHHVTSCYIRFRIQPSFILKPQNYFLKEHEIPSCTCLFFLSSLHNHHPFLQIKFWLLVHYTKVMDNPPCLFGANIDS